MEKRYLKKGNYAYMNGETMVSRTCSKCGELKSTDNYYRSTKGYAGYMTRCNSCAKVQDSKYQKENREKINKKIREWYAINAEDRRSKSAVYREGSRESILTYQRTYRKNKPEIRKAAELRRKARKKGLPNDVTSKQLQEVVSNFGGCALTGSLDFHIDHVIPLMAGAGGTVIENLVPLRGDLNMSKGDKNVFEWFNEVEKRFGLDRLKFEEMIRYLADSNNMTQDQYEEYVNEIHANRGK